MSWSKCYVLQSSLWNLDLNACTTVCKHDVSLNDNMCNRPQGLPGLIDALL